MITLSPGWSGFLKGIIGTAVWALVAYLSVVAHFSGIFPPTFATILSALFSALESAHKADSSGTSGLFGAVRIT